MFCFVHVINLKFSILKPDYIKPRPKKYKTFKTIIAQNNQKTRKKQQDEKNAHLF